MMARTALTVVFVGACLLGQNTARIVLDDGREIAVNQGETRREGNLTVALTAETLTARNGGGPDDWGGNKWPTEPVYFQRIEVRIPGRTIPLSPQNGAKPLGDDRWVLASETDFKHVHHKANDPQRAWYAKSKTFHMLDGGDTFYARFAPADDPWEWKALPGDAERKKALAVANLAPELLQKFPLLSRLLDFYTIRPSSNHPDPPIHDWGWWLNAQNHARRWRSTNPLTLQGWYGYTDIHAAGGGFSNGHYDHPAWFLVRYLLTGDRTAYTAGLYLIRFKVAYGLVDTDLPRSRCWQRGWWRGEKGDRRGSAVGLSANKEWDLGLVLASILAPNDPMIAHGMAVRRASLLERDDGVVWNGAGGGRAIGHFLENLLDHYHATGDAAFKERAARFIEHVFTKTGDLPYFPNSLRKGWNATWEEALAHVWIAKWIDEGIAPGRLDKLKAMVEWLITNGGRFRSPGVYEVAYEIEVPPTETSVRKFNTPSHQTWWVQVWPLAERWWPGRFTEAASASMTTCLTRIGQGWAHVAKGQPPLTPAALQVDDPGTGPSCEKTWPIYLHVLRK